MENSASVIVSSMATLAIEQEAFHLQDPPRTDLETPPKAEIQTRWKAGVLVPVNMPIEESWAVFGNFANPQEFMTQCLECKIVEGEPNAIKCVRYVMYANLDGSEGTWWAKERLLSIDHENYIQTYQIEDNSYGFVNYQGYIKISRGNNDTSVISWCLEMDPLPGMSPPPNLVTQMMSATFRLFIKHAESKFIRKKGTESTDDESGPGVSATA